MQIAQIWSLLLDVLVCLLKSSRALLGLALIVVELTTVYFDVFGYFSNYFKFFYYSFLSWLSFDDLLSWRETAMLEIPILELVVLGNYILEVPILNTPFLEARVDT